MYYLTEPRAPFGEENGTPPQCSCLENPRDGGAWWAAVCGVAQSWTRLKRLSSRQQSPFLAFPDGSADQESPCNSGDPGDAGSIPGSGRSPGGGKWQSSPVFLPEKKIQWTEEPGRLWSVGSQSWTQVSD